MKQVKLTIPALSAFDPVRDLDGRIHEIEDDVDTFTMRWNGRTLRFEREMPSPVMDVYAAKSIAG